MLPQSVLDKLTDLPRGSVVRVVVQGATTSNEATPDEPNPRDFESMAAYRTALLARHRSATRSAKDLVEAKARALGLKAFPATNLNAVTVEGPSESVLDLLSGVDIQTAVLERAIGLTR